MLVSFILLGLAGLAQIKVVELKCEYLKDPQGIDMSDPRFYWKLRSEETGQFQTGYRVIVSSSKENIEKNLGDMFDSGKKRSVQSTHVVYKGKPLKAASDYFWKVMAWDNKRVASGWSEIATFSMGLFANQDWKGAKWIAWRTQENWETDWWKRKEVELQCTEWYLPSYFGARMSMWERYNFHHDNPYDPAPLFRKEFRATKEVKSAKAFISGIGYNELFIMGNALGIISLIRVGQTIKKRYFTRLMNVTRNFHQGENAIGVMLGRGNYGMLAIDHWGFYKKGGYIGQPKLICRFKITYTDGSEENIVSDLSWKVTGGPILYDCPHMGELYDATKEIPDWNNSGFNDASWDKVQPAPSPGGELKAQLCEPIRITKRTVPVKVERKDRATYWADAGTNLTGWIRLKVNAPKGTRIGVYFGENEDPRYHGQPGGYQQMAYVAKGVKDEIAECHFSYKGFRYVHIVGYPGVLTADDIEVCQVNSDVGKAGRFSSSDTTLNAIHRICTKSLISNLHSIPTDCPHREKNGWMGDAVTGMEFGMANYDLAALMTKFSRDMFDTQDEEGRMSVIAPDNNYNTGKSPLWSSACIHVPWYMYNYYGDTRLFERYWDNMKLFAQAVWKYNGVENKVGIFTDGLADWCSPFGNVSEEGPEVYSTMNFHLVLKRMAQMAVVLNKKEDAAEFSKQAEQVREAIYTYCFDKEKVQFVGIKPSDYRQGINAMALQYGIVKPEHIDKVMEQLLRDIKVNRNFHFYGGIFTGHALWELLPKNNFSELTYKVAINPTYPGYGFMLKNGATSLWEFWQDKDSHIHHFLGFVDNFLIRHVAGINVNYKVPGFSEIVFSPKFIAEIDHAEADYESIHGMASIAWKKEPKGLVELNISVPCNCSGKLTLPEGIKSIVNSDGEELQIKKDDLQQYVVLPSGKHQVKAYLK